MGKAIGIGGVFLHFQGNSKDVFSWYEKYLGMDFSAYGSGFLDGEQLVTLTFKRDDHPEMPFLNLRVDNIKEIMQSIKQQNLKIISDVTTYDYGNFATFIDPFGNPIELWEAKPEQYRTLVKEEIKAYKQNKTPKL